ncbi:MAG: prephenate dehydratase [Deltaproteobacteria bacterium]|nr:MAG: prephenate dehydratase [Deltaproteobacteria bacterium]
MGGNRQPGNIILDDKGVDKKKLEDIRSKIDHIDKGLLELLNHRAALCKEVGEIKSISKESVFKPFREKEVMKKLISQNPGHLPDDHLRAIYREILSSSRKLQQPQKVVYLGPEGTFSYFAGIEYLGHSADLKPCNSLKEVFQIVEKREAELGIIPLENSLQGSVGQSLDLFLQYKVFIQAEVFCKTSHSLLSSDTSLARIQTVYSHPQALEQCSNWLRTHLPEVGIVPVESTSAAAIKVIDEKGSAAIGHEKLGDMFGLNILSSRIEDLPDNWTRFMIIGPTPPEGGHQDKTSLLFTLPDKSGALAGVLTVLAQNGINLKKLESRPLRSEKWKYVFFADLECDLSGEQYQDLKMELSKRCSSLQILGSYPAGAYIQTL